MAGEDLIDLKFRLFDGTDIGPNKYDPSTTVSSLKEVVLARWPQDKEIAPRTINDVKLINGGKILENSQTLAASRVPVADLPGGVITMHVVVRPPVFDKSNDADAPSCDSTILSHLLSTSGIMLHASTSEIDQKLEYALEKNPVGFL